MVIALSTSINVPHVRRILVEAAWYYHKLEAHSAVISCHISRIMLITIWNFGLTISSLIFAYMYGMMYTFYAKGVAK